MLEETILPAAFYDRDPARVARELVEKGMLLVANLEGAWVAGRTVEAEAYLTDDPACHAYRRITLRMQTTFGRAGRACVYFTYGKRS